MSISIEYLYERECNECSYRMSIGQGGVRLLAREEISESGGSRPRNSDELAHFPFLPDSDRRHSRARRALNLQRLDDERKLVHAFRGKLVQFQILQQVNSVDGQHDLMDR